MTNDNGTQPVPLTSSEKKRVSKCTRAVKAALRRHHCLILPQITIIGTTMKASIRILPRPS